MVAQMDCFLPGDQVRFKPDTPWAKQIMRGIDEEILMTIIHVKQVYTRDPVYTCQIESKRVIEYANKHYIFGTQKPDDGTIDVSGLFIELIERDSLDTSLDIEDLFELGDLCD